MTHEAFDTLLIGFFIGAVLMVFAIRQFGIEGAPYSIRFDDPPCAQAGPVNGAPPPEGWPVCHDDGIDISSKPK
jgi:hypothetical protein